MKELNLSTRETESGRLYSRHHTKKKDKVYVLNERYGYGYIINELYLDGRLVDIKSIKATENLTDIKFDDSVMLAEPFMIYESTRYEGRGGSIFDGKLDSYDSLDETWSPVDGCLKSRKSKDLYSGMPGST